MDILKHGNNDKFVWKYEFHCKCGCEFIADHTEISKREKSLDGRIWAKCPDCGAEIEPIDRDGWKEKVKEETPERDYYAGSIHEEKAKNIVKNERKFTTTDMTSQFMLDRCFVYAYERGCVDMIRKVEKWFRKHGNFVFPEDEELVNECVNYLSKVNDDI